MSSLSQKGNGAQSQTERGINPYRKENQLRPKRRRKQRKRGRDLAGIDFEIRNSFIQVFEFPHGGRKVKCDAQMLKLNLGAQKRNIRDPPRKSKRQTKSLGLCVYANVYDWRCRPKPTSRRNRSRVEKFIAARLFTGNINRSVE